MEKEIEYDLQGRFDQWLEQIKSQLSIIEQDVVELKSQMLSLIEELKLYGLDDEEAFFIASKRLAKKYGLRNTRLENQKQTLQISKSLIILGGVLVYYLIYFFVKSTARMLLSALLYCHVSDEIAIGWYQRYFLTSLLILLIFFIRMYFFEKKTISIIERIKIKPRHILQILFATIFFGIVDTCFLPIVKWVIKHDRYILNQYWDAEYLFNYSFSLLIILGFAILYLRYYKKVRYQNCNLYTYQKNIVHVTLNSWVSL